MASSMPVHVSDCRNTKAIVQEIGLLCPKCHKGQIVQRKLNVDERFMVPKISDCDFVTGINRGKDIS